MPPETEPSAWGWPGRSSLIPLAGLLLLGPLLRCVSAGSTRANGQRMLIGALELAFVLLALFEPHLRLPRLPRFGRSGSAPELEDRLVKQLGWAISIWLVWSGVATLTADHVEAAIVRQAEWLTHLLFAVVLHSLLRTRPLLTFRIALWIPLGLILYALYLPVFAFGLEDPSALRWSSMLPGFGNIRHLGYQLMFAILFCAPWLAYTSLRDRTGRIQLALFFLAWVALFWGGNRGAFMACMGGLAILVSIGVLPRPARFMGIASVVVLAAALVSAPLPVASGSMGIGHFLSSSPLAQYVEQGSDPEQPASVQGPPVDPPAEGGGKARSQRKGDEKRPSEPSRRVIPQRGRIVHIAAEAIGAAPLLGPGPDSFSFLRSIEVQPHNFVSQFMLDWGIPGALVAGYGLLLVFALGWLRLARPESRATRVVRVGALGAVGAAIIHALVDGTLYFAAPLMLCWVSIAIALLPADAGDDAPIGCPESATEPFWKRPVLTTLALGLAGILVLNLAVTRAVSREEPPAPDEWEARVIQAFPHRMVALNAPRGVFDWAQQLWPSDPEAAIGWLHLGHQKSRRPWAYAHLEAHYLFQRGRSEEALAHFELAETLADDFNQRIETRALARALGLVTP